MGLDGVKALEIEQRVDEAVRRRVAVDGGGNVGAERVAEAIRCTTACSNAS
jgi:hypothetical protein